MVIGYRLDEIISEILATTNITFSTTSKLLLYCYTVSHCIPILYFRTILRIKIVIYGLQLFDHRKLYITTAWVNKYYIWEHSVFFESTLTVNVNNN